MNCPFCGHSETKVTDSRDWEEGIRRRRECLDCGRRFTTVERAELGGLVVVKKDGRREEFSREKIISGVRKACEKRPIPSGAIEALADEVESTVAALGKAEVPASVIGEQVMERMRDLDHIAYIRFASVYRAFADVEELKEELAALEAGWQRPGVPSEQMALLPEAQRPQRPRLLRTRRSRSEEEPQQAGEAR
jgi:transcriptional repressor NrdR